MAYGLPALPQFRHQSSCRSSTALLSQLLGHRLPRESFILHWLPLRSAYFGDASFHGRRVMRVLWQVGTARSSALMWWSILQLLLVLMPLAGLLLVPNLAAHLPNFNAHILPAKVSPVQAPSPSEPSAAVKGLDQLYWHLHLHQPLEEVATLHNFCCL